MDNGDAAIVRLNAIKALGVSLSIDDFGTGYSSLNSLYRFPVDKLKIDRSFIQNMAAAPQNLALIHATIGLGHTLGRQVVAEGVSEESDARVLRDCGCDELQGFHFSRPLPALEVEGWMRDRCARAA
jgi:EAL domain-containing protein (putative c-di-GMP-specific phosphodiesterase class I)